MVTVAVAALILGLVERRARFARISLAHQTAYNSLGLRDLEMYLVLTPWQSDIEASPAEKVEDGKAIAEFDRGTRPLRDFIRYHAQMQEKYDRASDRPWLPVSSDPPPPPRPSNEFVKALLVRLTEMFLK